MEKPIYAVDNGGEENQPPNSPAKPISFDYVFKKDNARVKMPLSLTLDPFQASFEGDKTTEDYNLQSVVYHSGARASSGHYFTDALRRDVADDDGPSSAGRVPVQDVWYCFDDTNSARRDIGESITRDPNRQRNAYMLLYSINDHTSFSDASPVEGGDRVLFPTYKAHAESVAMGDAAQQTSSAETETSFAKPNDVTPVAALVATENDATPVAALAATENNVPAR